MMLSSAAIYFSFLEPEIFRVRLFHFAWPPLPLAGKRTAHFQQLQAGSGSFMFLLI